ncbi:MAG: YveK family protein [Chloroflexota bacterium]
MRPEEIVVQMLRWWWIVVIAAVVAAGVVYISTSAQDKEYTVSVRLMAIAEPPEYYMDLYAKNRLASYRELMNNWGFVSEAIDQAELDVDPGHVQNVLQLGHNPDSNTVQIVVVDTDPERAASIANALAVAFIERNEEENAEFIEQVQAFEDRYPPRIELVQLEEASAPATPSGPRVMLNTVAGGLVGALAGVALAFFLVYRDDTIKSIEDAERYLGGPVLAGIPDNSPGQRIGRRA